MTNIAISTLRPGLLVSLKTRVRGNVSYRRRDIESGQTKAKWETTRFTTDPKEFRDATQVRSRIRSKIRSVCAISDFGLLCPDSNAEKLWAAVAEARDLANAFNKTAKVTTVSLNVIPGRIAPDDVEAVKAINAEVRELLEDMSTGLNNLDAKVVREAAAKARQVGKMLSPAAAERIKVAIDTARSVARKIVKAGEEAAIEVDKVAVRKVIEQRSAFLDMDDADAIVAPKAVAKAVELIPEAQIKVKARKRVVVEIDDAPTA